MSGIWKYYRDFACLISSGFSNTYVFRYGYPTFPMWGYGFVFSLLPHKALTILLQQVLSLVVIFAYLKYLEKTWSVRRLNILKIALFFSFPLFLLNTAIAPYSIGASLLLLGLLYMVKYVGAFSPAHLVGSSVCFGLMLHFRSDYFYFLPVILIAAIIYLFRSHGRPYLLQFTLWGLIVLAIISPWAIHTHSRTGACLFTSTNSGHQLYMSLGQYPRNPWGIQKGDNSPQMLALVQRQFGNPQTLTYDADTFLRKQWMMEIKKYPGAYVKKIGYSFFDMCKHPFYIGDIYQKHEAANGVAKRLLSLILNTICRIFFLAVFFLAMWNVARRKFIPILTQQPLLFFFVLLIGWQVAMQSLVYSLFLYNTSIFFTYLVVLVCLLPIREGQPLPEPAKFH
jgi:hypothetical protein